MNSYFPFFGLIVVISLLVPAGLYLLRRALNRRGKMVRTISGNTFSLFASLYAFFLGFCVVTLWNAFGAAKVVVAEEANALLTASYFSRQFNDSKGFRSVLAEYTQSVIAEEWPDMDQKEAMNAHTHQLANQVWDAFRLLRPQNKEDNPLYANLGNVLLEASRHRNSRAQLLSGNIYPPVWVIIVFGFFGSCVALFCSNPEQDRGQVVMEFVVLFTVLSCIYFIYDTSSPFSGVLNVPHDAFDYALARMHEASPFLPGAASGS